MKDYIIIHGTNGEGYTEPVILRTTLAKALKYARKQLRPKARAEFYGDTYSFYKTDKEGTTERISIIPIRRELFAMVSIYANLTQYKVHPCKDVVSTSNLQNQFAAKHITELFEKQRDVICGEGSDDLLGDGFFHFSII